MKWSWKKALIGAYLILRMVVSERYRHVDCHCDTVEGIQRFKAINSVAK